MARRPPRPGRAAGVLAALLACAGVASAHGPTVAVSYARIQPAELRVYAGDTVHFQNTNGSAGTCTLVGDEGAFESPPLARGEGWHHRFDAPGRFPFRVSEMPSRRGVILVLPREPR